MCAQLQAKAKAGGGGAEPQAHVRDQRDMAQLRQFAPELRGPHNIFYFNLFNKSESSNSSSPSPSLSLSRIGIFIIITIASFALFNLAHVQPPSKSESDSQFGAWQGNHNAGTKQYANNFYRYMTEIHKMPNAEERARQTHVFMVTCV